MATLHADQARPLAGLHGRSILICRPEPEASRLAEVFRLAGARVRLMPMITREALAETPESRSILQNLDNFQHIIAVSPFAARLLLNAIDQWWPQMPAGIRWYGVGAGTAGVFSEQGLRPCKPARGWTSEDLLRLPSLQNIDNDKALLARGEHGRELIQQTLSQRGARVTILPLYRRGRPYYAPEQVQALLGQDPPDAVIALSGETLNNLIQTGADYLHTLRHTLVVVPAQRIADQARSRGFHNPMVPAGLTDQELVNSVATQLAPSAGDEAKASKDTRD